MNLITSLAMKVMGMGSLAGFYTEKLAGELDAANYGFLKPVLKVIDNALMPILICVIAAGTIYAVVLGVNMAKADSSDKREEAKKRLINAIVGFGIIIVLLTIMYAVAANISSILNIANTQVAFLR